MALTFDLNIPNSIETKHVIERGPYALLPPNDPLTKKRAVSLKDLTTRPFVLMDLPHTGEYFISLFSKQNLSPKIRYRTTLFETVRTFVASGLGVSILNLKPKSSITYNGGEVAIRPIIDNVEALNIVLIHYSRLQPKRIADTFSDHVIDYFL